METYTLYDAPQPSANAERAYYETQQPHPVKPKAELISGEARREATQRYVERVDRYLARSDVPRAGRHAKPSF